MELATVLEIISTLGFPIAVCVVLFWFVYQVYKKSEQREDDLRLEIKENQEINREAIKTLALYAERLEVIQTDIEEIKKDITILTTE